MTGNGLKWKWSHHTAPTHRAKRGHVQKHSCSNTPSFSVVRRPPREILYGKTGIASILAWGTSKVMSRCPNCHCWISVLLSLHGINVASAELDRKGNLAANSGPFLTPAPFYLSHLSSLYNNVQETILPGSLKKKKKWKEHKCTSKQNQSFS